MKSSKHDKKPNFLAKYGEPWMLFALNSLAIGTYPSECTHRNYALGMRERKSG